MAEQKSYGLPKAILSSVETLAQSIAGIAPTAAPAMTVALVFGMAGNASWLTYIIATVIVALTALNINVFAGRSSSPGSLYAYATEGGGNFLGFLAGWSMVAAYVFCTASCSLQCCVFFNALLQDFAIAPVSPLIVLLIVLSLVWVIAFRNVKLSAEMMLWLEVISIAIIAALLIHSVWTVGTLFDPRQLTLEQATPRGTAMGLVLAILAFVGFESAASLGSEAEMPLEKIPQAILWSVILSGAFFVITTYAIVQGFHDIPEKLSDCPTPLIVLAKHQHLSWLGTITNLGAAISFFACCLALTNAGARILLTMSSDGHLPAALKSVHAKNQTPAAGIALVILGAFATSAILITWDYPLIDIIGWLGTIVTYHFIIAYIIVSLVVPRFMKARGEFATKHLVLSMLASLSMLSAFIGTVVPTPPSPYCWLPAISLAYMFVGAVYFLLGNRDGVSAAKKNSHD